MAAPKFSRRREVPLESPRVPVHHNTQQSFSTALAAKEFGQSIALAILTPAINAIAMGFVMRDCIARPRPGYLLIIPKIPQFSHNNKSWVKAMQRQGGRYWDDGSISRADPCGVNVTGLMTLQKPLPRQRLFQQLVHLGRVQ